MLEIKIPESESFDNENQVFITEKEATLQLEHSLISISKWESKWNKPFLNNKIEKTSEEVLDYVKCMTINKVDDSVYLRLTQENINEISRYITASMTATTFLKTSNSVNREIITNEIIYYWMIQLNIPFECEKWHLNRLLTLIQVCSIKNSPKKKMSKAEILARNRELKAQRKKNIGTKG